MIIRTPKTSNYAVIDNRVLNDPRLSFKAKGVIALLLSKPDGWEVMTQHLINSGPDGRTAVESALAELETFGYITRSEQPRGGRGRFDNVTTIVHEEPTTGFPTNAKAQVGPKAKISNGEEPQMGTDSRFPRADNPRADNPRADNPRRVKIYSTKTERATTERERGGASAARPRSRHPIPEHFAITAAMRAWAVAEGIDSRVVERATSNFIDYYRGKGETRADWESAWKKWMRDERDKFSGNQNGKPASGMSYLIGRRAGGVVWDAVEKDFAATGRVPFWKKPNFDFDAEPVGEDEVYDAEDVR